MEQKVDLTVILPIYNPPLLWEEVLSKSLEKLFRLFDGIDLKVLLVNDGSSVAIEEEFGKLKRSFRQVSLISYEENKGKGYALRYGLKRADSRYYIYTDWDFPFQEAVLLEIYQKLNTNHFDLIIGNRTKSYYNSLPIFRKKISQGLRILNFFVLNFNYYDIQAGIKGLNNTTRPIFLATKTNGFIYEFEFVRACIRKKTNVSSLEVHLKEEVVFSDFGLKVIFRELKTYLSLIFK